MAKKPTPKATDLDPTVVSEIFTRRVAVLAMGGMTSRKIANEMGLSQDAIEKIQQREDYKGILKNIGEKDLNFEVAKTKQKLTQLADQSIKVYQKVMQDYLDGKTGARDAVTVAQSVNRAIGADREENKPQDSQLTIVLPGGKEIVTFDAETGNETV